jgi:hypothetical protein
MYRVGTFLKNEVFHTGISLLLAGLAEQHHQDYPFDLLDVDVCCFKGQKAVDEQLALRW